MPIYKRSRPLPREVVAAFIPEVAHLLGIAEADE